MRLISSIRDVAPNSKAWLVDIWGVLHNGVVPFPDAVAACQTFRRQGGIVILVSNAPRPHSAVGAQLDKIGVAQSAYDAIISSGDICRVLIAALGQTPVFHLGPERDRPLFDGLSAALTSADAADAIVCTGLYDDETETPQTYDPLLAACAARNLKMICANPDLAVERGGRIIPCAGAVAARYESLGGRAIYAGKPHPPIYDTAFALVSHLAGLTVAKENILAIGDGVNTDIAGAARAGIASVYIASGVHLKTALDTAALEQLFSARSGRPSAAMTTLAW